MLIPGLAEGAAMVAGSLWTQRWLRGTDTMLGQVRTLFLGVLLLWPAFGLWGLLGSGRVPAAAAVATALAVVGWLYAGYRRQGFPAWSWIFEGAGVCLVAAAAEYGPTIGLCVVWVSFRALYGRLGEKLLGAAVVCAILTAGIVTFDVRPGAAIPLFFTA